MLTTVCTNDLDFVCKSVQDLVEKCDNENRKELEKITRDSLMGMVKLNDERYCTFSQDQLREDLLSSIADIYNFSSEVKNGLKKTSKKRLYG
ncbi:hypothetical protein AGMMS50255_3360 [Spirochaetia bacterium]|nr:hypothetical protein AGMMS50255_3360 [Spirochaetia bacterium]